MNRNIEPTQLERRNYRKELAERDRLQSLTVKPRELVPIRSIPVYDPMRSRAFRNVLERIDPNRSVISMGRK